MKKSDIQYGTGATYDGKYVVTGEVQPNNKVWVTSLDGKMKEVEPKQLKKR